MPVSHAWLLSFSDQFHAAIGSMEMMYILPSIPELIESQGAPAFCRYVFTWEGRTLPLMDLALYLSKTPDQTRDRAYYTNKPVGIVAYHIAEQEQQKYGALLMNRVPVRVEVDDEQACGLPEEPAGWSTLALSCFKHDDYGRVPILDIPQVFSYCGNQGSRDGDQVSG